MMEGHAGSKPLLHHICFTSGETNFIHQKQQVYDLGSNILEAYKSWVFGPGDLASKQRFLEWDSRFTTTSKWEVI